MAGKGSRTSDSASANRWGALEYLQFMMSGDMGGSARPGVEADNGDKRESIEPAGELAYATSSCIIVVASWKIR
jgi:hypothetical protein